MSVSVTLPQVAEWAGDGAVAEWYLPDGAAVRTGDPVCRFESGFVSLELEAEGDGILSYRHGVAGGFPPNGVLAFIVAEGEPLPGFDQAPCPADASLPEPGLEPAEDPGAASEEPSLPAAPEPPRGTRNRNEPFQEWRFEATHGREPTPTPTPKPHPFEPMAPAADSFLPADAPPAEEDEPAEDGHLHEGHAATVLPFHRRFSLEHGPADGSAWDAVPGDAVDFANPLVAPAERVADPDVAEWVESGPESPAAEPDDSVGATTREYGWERWALSETADEELGRVEVVPQGLFIRVTVDLSETCKMRGQLAREWKAAGVAPSTDDIVLRAVARSLRELPAFDATRNLALRAFTPEAETFRVLARAAERPFREAVAALADPPDPETEPGYDCVVTSFAALGIEDATPRLEPGRPFALAVGAEHEVVAIVGDRAVARIAASIVLAYDATIVDDGTAARLLARVRGLIEAPYALLAD